jgi:hypothetical protein
MKIRSGFVSNSSSSSFIIPHYRINSNQMDMIWDHVRIAKKIDEQLVKEGKERKYEYYEEWQLKSDDFSLWCSTSMDNFRLIEFLIDEVKLNHDDIFFEDDKYWWDETIFEEERYIKLKTDYQRSKKIKKIKNKLWFNKG